MVAYRAAEMDQRKRVKQNTLFLSYDGLTDPLGQSQILPYLKGLSQNGHRITIVSFEKQERFNKDKAKIGDYCKANGLEWVPLRYHKDPPVVSAIYDLLSMRRVCTRLYRKEKFTLVHCRSYLTALTGLHLKRKYGLKFIFDMRGFWADERVEGKIWNLKNPVFRIIYQYFKKMEKRMLSHADAVISLTHAAKKVMHRWGVKAHIHVIPCSVDLTLFQPAKIKESMKVKARADLGLGEEDFVLLYLGSLGTWYLYDAMITFFHDLKKLKPSARFLFLTPDVHVVEPHPDFIVRKVSREEVPLYASVASCSLCFILPSYSKQASSATKIGELLALNIPIFVNEGWGDVDDIFKDHPSWVIHLNKSLETQIATALNEPRIHWRSIAEKKFNVDIAIRDYDRIYSDLCGDLTKK
jgi:glycosyltransferase involved in cell wall biosynthesis